MNERNENFSVTYTVRAEIKDGHGKYAWLRPASGPMAPRFSWSYGKPDIGYDMNPERVFEEARSCGHPITTKVDYRTLRLFQLVQETKTRKVARHCTPSDIPNVEQKIQFTDE